MNNVQIFGFVMLMLTVVVFVGGLILINHYNKLQGKRDKANSHQ